MKRIYLSQSSILLLSAFLILSCSNKKSNEIEEQSTLDTMEVTLVSVKEEWIENRVKDAKARLQVSSAGQKLWEAIEAHGTLNTWFENGPISFHFDYQPLDDNLRRNTYQVVDKWSVRAVQEMAENREVKFGWDGTNAWIYPDSVDLPINPRFWSITPYYFVGLPFVLADEGVILEELGKKEYNGITYDLIKASYEKGIGDAPGDYYVIYINPETNLMEGLRYIVSYPGFFPAGNHSPEKFMEILDTQVIDGIIMPTGYKTYWFKENEPAEHITNIDVMEVSFVPGIENSYFDVPSGAKIQKSY
ncbi:MAG: DUF6503 family protein [Bacteroidota bacterium]